VNTAARIEQACPPGSVLISRATCRRSGLDIPSGFCTTAAVKGRDDPVDMFDLMGYAKSLGDGRSLPFAAAVSHEA
jgi:class 3 adenylate cyclase